MYIRMNYTDSSILDITKSYISMINQFIDAFLQISFEPAATPSIEQYDCMLYIGINLIYRVYKYGLLKFKNIKTAEYYSQKAHMFFIEYTEQIYNHELTFNINHNDAILFIYRKTIFDFDNIDSKQGNDKVVNMFSLKESNEVMPNIENCISHLQQLHIFVNQLVQWKHTEITTINRTHVCKHYLQKLLKNTDFIEIITCHLEYICNNRSLSFSNYCNILDETANLLDSKTYTNEINKNDIIIMKYYTGSAYIQEKIDKNQMKELVLWLYGPTIM
jgi:hypothetical protein